MHQPLSLPVEQLTSSLSTIAKAVSKKMSGKTKAELMFIPSPGRGHLIAALEMAKLLTDRNESLSITILLIKPYFNPKSSKADDNHDHSTFPRQISRIRFIDIPRAECLPPASDPFSFQSRFVENHKGLVRNEVAKIVQDSGSDFCLAGLVVDLYCTSMIDVAHELDVPSYVFFTSGASVLGLMFHFQRMRDYQNQDLTMYEDSGDEFSIPSYENPVPTKALPSIMFEKDGGRAVFFNTVRRFRETKGILVNTFMDLELHAMNSFYEDRDQKIPPVFPVGPVLHLNNENHNENPNYNAIMKWLNDQPDSSVVYLCFGSKGCFDENQVKEIATALERSGHRFLWSLMKPSTKHKFDTPGEYENPREVLPLGFLERTTGIGKVIGWAPQVAVLSHRAVGGFVSHCGWNSILESVWFGVPMAVWPLSAEQQVNAFQVVKDLGVGVEIKMDYKKGRDMMVTANEIENGIRRLMEPQSGIKVNVQAMKVKSRMASVQNGSSLDYIDRFIESVMVSTP